MTAAVPVRKLAPRSGEWDLTQLTTLTRTRFPGADVNRVDDPTLGPCVAVYLPTDPVAGTVTAWQADVAGYTVTHPTAEEQAATAAANLATLQTKAQQLLTANTNFIGAAKPATAAAQASQAYDQCVTLSKGVDGIVRVLYNLLDSITGT